MSTSATFRLIVILLAFLAMSASPVAQSKGGKGGDTLLGKVLKNVLAKSAGKGIEVLLDGNDEAIKSMPPAEFEKQLVLLQFEMNKLLPDMLDDYTRRDQISLTYGSVFTVHHTLVKHLRPEIDIAQFSETMRQQLAESSCSGSFTRKLLDKNMVLGYTYNSVTGAFVTSIFIEKADCE